MWKLGIILFKLCTTGKLFEIQEKTNLSTIVLNSRNKIYPQLFHKVWINLRKLKSGGKLWITDSGRYVEKCPLGQRSRKSRRKERAADTIKNERNCLTCREFTHIIETMFSYGYFMPSCHGRGAWIPEIYMIRD